MIDWRRIDRIGRACATVDALRLSLCVVVLYAGQFASRALRADSEPTSVDAKSDAAPSGQIAGGSAALVPSHPAAVAQQWQSQRRAPSPCPLPKGEG